MCWPTSSLKSLIRQIRLQIMETRLIKNLSAYKSLNVNIDSFECKLW